MGVFPENLNYGYLVPTHKFGGPNCVIAMNFWRSKLVLHDYVLINLVLSIELIWYGTQMFNLWLTMTNRSISSSPTKHLDLSIVSVVIKTSQFSSRLTSWGIDTLCWSGLSCIIQLWYGHRLRIDAMQKRFLRKDFFVKLCYTVEIVIKFIVPRPPWSTFRIWWDD